MIQTNELRFNNFVLINGEITKVYELHRPDYDDKGIVNNLYYEFEPIPLTEEWLLKFGWVWNEECNSFEKYPNGDARLNLDFHSVNQSYTMFNYVTKALICKNIRYVHQLQNLYFALTGEELTIKF